MESKTKTFNAFFPCSESGMVSPNTQSPLLTLLSTCKTLKHLTQVHGHLITTTTLQTNTLLLSKLIDASTTIDLDYAHSIFATIPNPTAYIYNSLIRAHSSSANPLTSLSLYRDMHRGGLSPDNFTFPFVLKSCASLSALRFGRCVHSRVVGTGYGANLYVSSGLVHMYASCADLVSAEAVFEREATVRNVVAWTIMIGGYAGNGREMDAVRLFRRMVEEGGEGGVVIEPNEVTLVHVLAACARASDLESGKWIHGEMRRRSWTRFGRNVVLDTALVDFYGSCGSLEVARKLFDRMPVKNEVSWNAMISAYNQYDRYDELIELFVNMLVAGVSPDKVTILGLLGACAGKGARSFGREIHAYVERSDTSGSKDVEVYTSVMDMYCKTGDTKSALKIFRCLQSRDVLVWTSMITGLATHGRGIEATNLFKEMEEDGVVPDHITFIGVLTACSHAGLIDEGLELFSSMRSRHGIEPGLEHYGCMVNLLSRAGRLAEAERMVASMPIRPSAEVWGAVLSGCEIHGDVELAEKAGREIAKFDPVSSGVYVLLSNVCAGAEKWGGVEKARELMRHKGVEKTLGYSCIES